VARITTLDQHRRLHRGRRHAALVEGLGDQQAAAEAGRGKRLVGEHLGQAQSNRRSARDVAGCRTGDDPPDASLGDVRPDLQGDGRAQPPRLGLLRHACERAFFGTMEHGRDNGDQQSGSEQP